MNKKKKRWIFWSVAAVCLGLLIWTLWGNKAVELNRITLTSEHLPEAFDGFRIAHVSDYHNTEFGTDNETLLELLREAAPDLIAITGDLIDSRRTDIEVALRFAEAAVEIAPCYYVAGNHESRISAYSTLKSGLEERGVIVLENESLLLERGDSHIRLLGVRDPAFGSKAPYDTEAERMKRALQGLSGDETEFRILLSHRPELFSLYGEQGFDLVLSGHAHGGQLRIPFLGGVIAPHQGLFPQYDGGLYAEGRTHMVVSRGLGNSIFPLRFNNRPEIILIELQSQ